MSTAAKIECDSKTGEAIVTFEYPDRWRPDQTRTKIVNTGMYFERSSKKAVRDWQNYPTEATALRMAAYLAEYLPPTLRAIELQRLTNETPEGKLPPQLYIIVESDTGKKLKVSAGELAAHVLATTAYDYPNDRVTQEPEGVMIATAGIIAKEAADRTTDDLLGETVAVL